MSLKKEKKRVEKVKGNDQRKKQFGGRDLHLAFDVRIKGQQKCSWDWKILEWDKARKRRKPRKGRKNHGVKEAKNQRITRRDIILPVKLLGTLINEKESIASGNKVTKRVTKIEGSLRRNEGNQGGWVGGPEQERER